LTLDLAQTLVSDNKARVDAFNWLLSVGLFKPLHDEKGKLVAFRAVTKSEIAAYVNEISFFVPRKCQYLH
jgi:DNA-directed RNA polymerase III subunit RPC6